MTNSQTSEGRAAGGKEAHGTAGKHWPPVVWVCFGGSLATAQSTAWTSLIIDINNDGQQLVTVLVPVWISSKLYSNSADDDVIWKPETDPDHVEVVNYNVSDIITLCLPRLSSFQLMSNLKGGIAKNVPVC